MQTHCASQPLRGKRDESNISLYACRRIGQADVSWTHAAPGTVNYAAGEEEWKGGERGSVYICGMFSNHYGLVLTLQFQLQL